MDVVVSDLHIGSIDSTFSSSTGEEVLKQFCRELKDTDTVETLILLGDVFDFWDENLFKSLKMASSFFEEISRITDKIVYIPGNHDHHSLILCKEMQLINEMEKGTIPEFSFQDILKYEFPKKDPGFIETHFLNGFLSTSEDVHIQVYYPEYSYRWRGKDVLFRHGHYLDSGLFKVMPYLYEHLGGRIIHERDFETVNTPVYEFLYYCGSIREINDFYKRAYNWIYKMTQKFYKRSKHKAIADRKEDIQRFFSMFKKGNFPDILVFGHTHVAGRETLDTMDVFNSGCWVSEKNIPLQNTYVVIADDIEVRQVLKGKVL